MVGDPARARNRKNTLTLFIYYFFKLVGGGVGLVVMKQYTEEH